MGSKVPVFHSLIVPCDFPELYRVANSSAEKYQLRYRVIVVVIASASFLCASTAFLTESRLGIAFVIGFASLQVSATMLMARTRWNHDWYVSRALSESVKSLTWRFAVCASPFPQKMSLCEAKTELSRAISALVEMTIRPDIASGGTTPPCDELTKFGALRQADLQTRRQSYLDQRLRNQLDWYAIKSDVLSKQRRMFDWLMVCSSIAALTLGFVILTYPSVFDISVIACATALPLGLVAIGQSLNLQSDVSAYRLTNAEIQRILCLEPPSNETEWADWVADQEEAISREHVLWLAKRNTLL